MEYPNWFTFGLASAALLLSIYNTWWQRREASRNREPDLTIKASYEKGVENREGRPGLTSPERISIHLLSASAVTVERAGIANPRSQRGWHDVTGDTYTIKMEKVLSGKFPPMPFRADLPQVCEGHLNLTFEVPFPLPAGLQRTNGVRVWVQTSSKHRVVSEVLQLPDPLPWPEEDTDTSEETA